MWTDLLTSRLACGLWFLAAGSAGCADGDVDAQCDAPAAVLADATAWRVLTDSSDPWGGDDQRCPASQHRTEVQPGTRWHEIETRGCSSASLEQSALTDACAGSTLHFSVWHFPITEGDGTWTLSFTAGEPSRILFEQTVPIPSEPDVFDIEVVLDDEILEGESLWLHLSNHGTNTWNVYDIGVRPHESESQQ